MRWHRLFATGGNKFPNPNPVAAGGQKPLPFFFEKNPMAKELFTKYADSNLNLLSSGFMTEYVNSTLIPILLKEQNQTLAEEDKFNRSDFRLFNGFLKNSKTPRLEVPQRTVLNWMNELGYKYCKVTKHYFNDKHEEKTNVLYLNDIIIHYFTYKRWSYRWIHMSEDEAGRLVAEKKVHAGFGYQYSDHVTGERMVKYHVDDSEHMFKLAGGLYPGFGGLLSFRMSMKPCEKPHILFGQDEAIFKQYLLTSKVWVG
jgi:hypothetical protein